MVLRSRDRVTTPTYLDPFLCNATATGEVQKLVSSKSWCPQPKALEGAGIDGSVLAEELRQERRICPGGVPPRAASRAR